LRELYYPVDFLEHWHDLERRRALLGINFYSVWRSKTSDLTLRLHQEVYLGLIYYSGEFHSDWRSPSTGPNYWVLTVFRRAQFYLRIQCFGGATLGISA
jgi:hypothetical protein